MNPTFIKFQGKLYIKAEAEERVATRAEWIESRPGDRKDRRGPRAPAKVKVDPKPRDERIQGELAPLYDEISGYKRDLARLKADYATEFKHYDDLFDEYEKALKTPPSPVRDKFIGELIQEIPEVEGKTKRLEKLLDKTVYTIKRLEHKLESAKHPLAQPGESLAVDPKAMMLEPDAMKIRKHKELEAAIQRAVEHKQALEQAKVSLEQAITNPTGEEAVRALEKDRKFQLSQLTTPSWKIERERGRGNKRSWQNINEAQETKEINQEFDRAYADETGTEAKHKLDLMLQKAVKDLDYITKDIEEKQHRLSKM